MCNRSLVSVRFQQVTSPFSCFLLRRVVTALIIYTEHFFSFFLQSIIFIRDHNTVGQEVSGYIDYAHRLKTCDFDQIFSGKKKLMPGHSDLW